MQASLPVVRAPKRALAFLKKVKRTRLIAARPVGSGGPAPHLSGVRQRVPLAWGPPLPHPGAPGLSGLDRSSGGLRHRGPGPPQRWTAPSMCPSPPTARTTSTVWRSWTGASTENISSFPQATPPSPIPEGSSSIAARTSGSSPGWAAGRSMASPPSLRSTTPRGWTGGPSHLSGAGGHLPPGCPQGRAGPGDQAGGACPASPDSFLLLDQEGEDITQEYEDPEIDQSWGAGTGTAERFSSTS